MRYERYELQLEFLGNTPIYLKRQRVQHFQVFPLRTNFKCQEVQKFNVAFFM